jgi:hypothetical protein
MALRRKNSLDSNTHNQIALRRLKDRLENPEMRRRKSTGEANVGGKLYEIP